MHLPANLPLIRLLFPLLGFFSPAGVLSVSLDSASCDGNCIQEMERLIDATPSSSSSSSSIGLLYGSNEQRTFMSQFFRAICDSYRDVDECLSRCETRSKQVAELKTAYSGLQFVCKERREEFFGSLPCLSENEWRGLRKCSAQINQSQETTQLFTNSITSREFHSMQMRFSALCRDLSAVIRCLLPVINESCGESPANLLLKFIGLEFGSFEALYRQLGFDTPLPVSCRTLIKHAMAHDQRALQQQKAPFSRTSAKIYKFYVNGAAEEPSRTSTTLFTRILSSLAITSLSAFYLCKAGLH